MCTFFAQKTASSGDEQMKLLHHLKTRWLVLPTLTLVWLGMVGIGLSWMWKYEATPGVVTAAQMQWPDDSQIERNPDCPTLVVFAHPHCPCTRATIGELAMVVDHCPERVAVRVLFFKPPGFSAGWEKTDLWSSAGAIPGVKVVCDVNGTEAKRFRATTSGHSLLYHQDGQLLFSGGITGSRGHSGDNAGRSAIESFVMNGQSNQQQQTFVFGCALLEKEVACGTECQR